MPKKVINTSKAPAANGCYSQGIVAGGFLFVSGQLPIVPSTKQKLVNESLAEQTKQVLNNIKGVVEAAGGSMNDVVKVTVYLDNMDNWDQVNEVYETFFEQNPPARCVLEVASLHYGFKIEADAVACLP